MIVTEHLFAIEDQTECLISALLESDAVQNYKEAKKAMYASAEVAQLQKAFLEAKSAFERVEAYGIHAPDFREKQRALRKAKRALDLNEIVANYRFAETNVQTLLDTIGLKIAQLISEDIKVDAGNPFFERGKKHSGCGGSCHASERRKRIYASRASLPNCLGIHIKTVKTVTPIWTDSLCFTKNEICGDLHE